MTGQTWSGDSDTDASAAPLDAEIPGLAWRYRILVENTADVVFHSIDGILQWVSPSIEDLTGWTPQELTGSPTAHLWHPDDIDAAVAQRDATYTGRATRSTLRLMRKDGHYVWLDVALKPYREPDGRSAAVGSLRDVSDLIQARTEAELRGQHLQQAFDSMLDPHVLLSPALDHEDAVQDFAVTVANTAAAQVLGRSRDDLIGRRLTDLVPAPGGADMTTRLAAWLAAGDPVVINDWQAQSGCQAGRFFDLRASVVGTGLLVAWRDVTQRHATRARLEQSEAAYRLLAENAADIILRLDGRDAVSWASPSCHRLLGYLPEKLLGPLQSELVHPQDRQVLHDALATLRSGTTCVVSEELRLRHVYGAYSWWAVSARRTSDDHASSDVVLAFTTIDKQKRAQLAAEEQLSLRLAALDSMLDPHVLLQCVKSREGDIIDFTYIEANAAACSYMQRTKAQLIGRTVLELLPAHAKTGLLELYIETVTTGAPLVLNNYEYAHEILGTPRIFDIRAVKVGDCLSFTWRDVTEPPAGTP